jgi:hypothetical protein
MMTHKRRGSAKSAIGVLLIVLAFVIPIAGYFITVAQAEYQYTNRYGSHATMAYDQATLAGMKAQLLVIQQNMYQDFGTDNATLGGTYSAPNVWPWQYSRTYDNSLLAEQDYMLAAISRIDQQQAAYNAQLNSTGVSPISLNDVYNQMVNNTRNELARAGGIDWAIHDAWMLKFNAAAYWFWYWAVAIAILLALVGIVFFAMSV